jgi:hypothetical protein
MTREHDDTGRGAHDVEPGADLQHVLARLERPTARPEFRAELRERFLAGSEAASPHVGSTDAIRAGPQGDASARGGRRLVLLAGALAAAAAIVLMLFLTRTRTSLWRVHPGSTASSVVVDGVAMRVDDPARLAEALATARDLETVGGMLRISVRDEAWIELAPGTRLTQMKFAAAGPYELFADRGSLAVATTPAFGGRGMRVRTAELDMRVTGTVFGVDVTESGSCLCTLEGSVRCEPTGGKGPQAVDSGRMCFGFRDRRAPTWGGAHEEHLKPLRDLRAVIE